MNWVKDPKLIEKCLTLYTEFFTFLKSSKEKNSVGNLYNLTNTFMLHLSPNQIELLIKNHKLIGFSVKCLKISSLSLWDKKQILSFLGILSSCYKVDRIILKKVVMISILETVVLAKDTNTTQIFLTLMNSLFSGSADNKELFDLFSIVKMIEGLIYITKSMNFIPFSLSTRLFSFCESLILLEKSYGDKNFENEKALLKILIDKTEDNLGKFTISIINTLNDLGEI